MDKEVKNHQEIDFTNDNEVKKLIERNEAELKKIQIKPINFTLGETKSPN